MVFIARPKISILSATEEVLESVPSSIEAKELTKRAKDEEIDADVFGPMAFDNSVSEKAAQIISKIPADTKETAAVKDSAQKLIRLFRGESFPQRNIKALKSSAKHWGTTLAEMKKDRGKDECDYCDSE